MRLSPASNSGRFLLRALTGCALLLAPGPVLAQQQMSAQQQAVLENSLAAAVRSMPSHPSLKGGIISSPSMPAAPPSYYAVGPTASLTQAEYDRRLKEPDSPQAHAEKLAAKRQSQRNLEKTLTVDAGEEGEPPPPEDLVQLQNLKDSAETPAGAFEDPDAKGKKEADTALDLRRDAQKEAALSFGARGGLAKRNYEIMERLKGFETTLDQVFNFRALLLAAPSGMLIEPPIVREAVDSLLVTDGGNEAAVADRIYDINKQAKIVTAPRDWRQYLLQTWVSKVPKPPRLLWPKDAHEQKRWNEWVALGWRAGAAQADAMFEANLARLTADYQGMVRYRSLLAQGMISQPYAMHEDRGVTGSKTVMRVGDRALRITGPSQFLTGSDLWKPADR